MKRNIFYVLLAVCAFSSTLLSAKTDKTLIKANYLYNHLAYHEAIGYYTQPGVDMNDPVILTKLGDCYRLTKMFPEAAATYQKAISMNGCPDEAKLYDGQVLMSLGQYDAAAQVLRRYAEVKPNDRRVANMLASCQQVKQMNAAFPNGSVDFESFNSNGSDFGPALRGNDLYYTTDTFINKKGKIDEWTGESFYRIYKVPLNGSAQYGAEPQSPGGRINTKFHDGPCTFTADGKEMYFTRTTYVQKFITRGPLADQNNVVHLEIMVASDYDEDKKEYKKIAPFRYNNKNYSCAHPAISKDGYTMIFSSDMPGGMGGTDLYMSKKGMDGNWSAPVNMGKDINTEGEEMFPFLDWKNNLYYSSDGLVGLGGLDVYEAKMDGSNNYSNPVNVGMPVNSPYDDMSFILDDTYKTGYFASNRPAEKGGDNIYRFNRGQVIFALQVVDENTDKPIRSAQVTLSAKNDNRTFTTDEQGMVYTQLYPFASYNVNASKPQFESNSISFTSAANRENDTLGRVIKLKFNSRIALSIVIMDQDKHIPIENPKLVFVKNEQHTTDTIQLGTGEVFNGTLKTGETYSFYGVKDGYYGNEKFVSTKDISPDAGNIIVADTIFMKHLEVGQVYKIDNIYYDFNKANIREDAKPSLTRLIELLKQYPNMHIQINSHTDCRGKAAYNLHLSNARAESVIKYLSKQGIKMNRLKFKGFGMTVPVEKCPVCSECTEDQHQKNRRTEFQIISM